MIIYKAINLINDKIYIGKTTKTLEIRKRLHKNTANSNADYCKYFHRAIRKYNFNNFEWVILAETDCESKLNIMGKFYRAKVILILVKKVKIINDLKQFFK